MNCTVSCSFYTRLVYRIVNLHSYFSAFWRQPAQCFRITECSITCNHRAELTPEWDALASTINRFPSTTQLRLSLPLPPPPPHTQLKTTLFVKLMPRVLQKRPPSLPFKREILRLQPPQRKQAIRGRAGPRADEQRAHDSAYTAHHLLSSSGMLSRVKADKALVSFDSIG
jgi:hypothetical protein